MMRYARYAAAVVFALLAVGFVTLWVRSGYRWDQVNWRVNGKVFVAFNTYWGTFDVRVFINSDALPSWLASGVSSTPIAMVMNPSWPTSSLPGVRYEWRYNAFGAKANLPYWCLAASSLGLAALFAFKRSWRFSLRTILVVTTVLAGLLGFAVYAI